MSLLDRIFGRLVASWEGAKQRLGGTRANAAAATIEKHTNRILI